MTKLCKLTVQVLIDSIKSLLQFLVCQLAYGVVGRVMVDVWEKNGLRERGLDVLARASITVAACTNLTIGVKTYEIGTKEVAYFVVEGAIDTVLLRTEDVCLDASISMHSLMQETEIIPDVRPWCRGGSRWWQLQVKLRTVCTDDRIAKEALSHAELQTNDGSRLFLFVRERSSGIGAGYGKCSLSHICVGGFTTAPAALQVGTPARRASGWVRGR